MTFLLSLPSSTNKKRNKSTTNRNVKNDFPCPLPPQCSQRLFFFLRLKIMSCFFLFVVLTSPVFRMNFLITSSCGSGVPITKGQTPPPPFFCRLPGASLFFCSLLLPGSATLSTFFFLFFFPPHPLLLTRCGNVNTCFCFPQNL
jgi:hypothetical protein